MKDLKKGVFRQVLLNENYRLIAFAGDVSRLRLIRRLAKELTASGLHGVITSSGRSMLPPKGNVVASRDSTILADQVQRMLEKESLVYAAGSINNLTVEGLAEKDILQLAEKLPGCFFLIDLPEIPDSKSNLPWQQLCICSSLDDSGSPSVAVPAGNNVDQIYFIDGIRNLERENRFISLAREWLSPELSHVVLADLNRDFLRKIEATT